MKGTLNFSIYLIIISSELKFISKWRKTYFHCETLKRNLIQINVEDKLIWNLEANLPLKISFLFIKRSFFHTKIFKIIFNVKNIITFSL
jgi:hypothetical protein